MKNYQNDSQISCKEISKEKPFHYPLEKYKCAFNLVLCNRNAAKVVVLIQEVVGISKYMWSMAS